MQETISKSVGRNANNSPDDVAVVRRLLARNRHLLVPLDDLAETGGVDEELVKRIETYQRRVVCSMESPDGTVDPGGATLRCLNANARDIRSARVPLFPLSVRPSHSYKDGGRQFRFRRDGGARLHAACDLKAPPGTPIRAMDDGTVLDDVNPFYEGTFELAVDHGGYVARYGEISGNPPSGIRKGVRVRRGDTIAFVGKLNSGKSMLHLELYSGTEHGPLTTGALPFKRRGDLLNPTDFLDVAAMTESDGRDPPMPDAAFGRVAPRVNGKLRLRKTAEVGAEIVRELETGTRVHILGRVVSGGHYQAAGETRSDWLQVRVEDDVGFVAAFFIDGKTTIGRVSNGVQTVLNMRSRPMRNADLIARLSPGTRFEIASKVEGAQYDADGMQRTDWFEIDFMDQRGFVAAAFIDAVADDDSGSADEVNAILFTFEPAGASDNTASQDRLDGGVAASRTMAQTDRPRVMKFKDLFIAAGAANDLPPALLAAIASRESRGGNVLASDGTGDNGNGYGLMQVDRRSHQVDKSEGPFGAAHIRQATAILKAKLVGVQDAFPSLSASMQLQTAVSRYNGGAGHAAPRSDEGTTGRDYCNDVWARAVFYAKEESWV